MPLVPGHRDLLPNKLLGDLGTVIACKLHTGNVRPSIPSPELCTHTQVLEHASCYRQKQHLKTCNVLMRYTFLFQRLGNYWNIDRTIASILKPHNFSGHKQAWYSFKVLTKLLMLQWSKTPSHTESQIHKHFSPLPCFSKKVPACRRESPRKSTTEGLLRYVWIPERSTVTVTCNSMLLFTGYGFPAI